MNPLQYVSRFFDRGRKTSKRAVNQLPPDNIAVRVLADKILQSIPGVAVEVKDPLSLRYVRVNEEACRWLRSTEVRLLGKTTHEILRDEESSRLIDAADREAVRMGQHEMEAWVQLNEGDKRRIRSTRFLYKDKFGHQMYLVTLSQDITSQHAAFMRAEDIERTTRSLLAGLPFPLMWLDRQQIIKGTNLSFNTFTGVELPVNHSLVDVFPFAVAESIRRVCLMAEKANRPMTQQTTVWVHSDSEREMVVHVCPMHDQHSQVMGTVTALYDVTDLVRSTKISSQLTRAFDVATDAVVLTNRRNEITYVNAEFCRQYGYTPEEVIGQHPSMLKSGIHGPSYYEHLWATLGEGATWQSVMVDRTKSGSLVTSPTTIAPILNGSKSPVAYLCIKHTEGRYETPVASDSVVIP
jgi:PAS domain S-box-containing protein